MTKIPLLSYWIKLYFWMPKMKLGYHTVYYDGVWYYALNAHMFSILVTTFPIEVK